MPQGAIKGTHGTGFCNLNIFLAHSRQYAKASGVELEFVNTPTQAEMVTFLGMGQVDIGLMPYTSFMALYDAGAPVKIVAGGGVEGCAIGAQPGLDSPEKLKGKTLGTFQLDTLEVMPYDYLKKNGVAFKDVKVRYMGSTPEAVEAFKAGALDWICTIEPYASALVNDVKGAVMLTDGVDLYGKGYTDCVLGARSSLMKDNPAGSQGHHQGHDAGAVRRRAKARRSADRACRQVLQDLDGERQDRQGEAAGGLPPLRRRRSRHLGRRRVSPVIRDLSC
jgi:NitT/TauT family transport system substrate-binding protein